MTFAEWWGSLTEAEHRLLGKTNAAFVWLCATQAEREGCAKIAERYHIPMQDTIADQIGAEIRARGNT